MRQHAAVSIFVAVGSACFVTSPTWAAYKTVVTYTNTPTYRTVPQTRTAHPSTMGMIVGCPPVADPPASIDTDLDARGIVAGSLTADPQPVLAFPNDGSNGWSTTAARYATTTGFRLLSQEAGGGVAADISVNPGCDANYGYQIDIQQAWTVSFVIRQFAGNKRTRTTTREWAFPRRESLPPTLRKAKQAADADPYGVAYDATCTGSGQRTTWTCQALVQVSQPTAHGRLVGVCAYEVRVKSPSPHHPVARFTGGGRTRTRGLFCRPVLTPAP